MEPREAFRVLGVHITADAGEVKLAYRNIVRQLHSDLHQDKSAADRAEFENALREVNAAWECLKTFQQLPLLQRQQMLGVLDNAPPPAAFTSHASAAKERSRSGRGASASGVRRGSKHRRRSPWWLVLPAAAIPLVIALWYVKAHMEPSIATASANGAMRSDGLNDLVWQGRSVAVAVCRDENCGNPDCSAGPLIESLHRFYQFSDAYVLYGQINRHGVMVFHEVASAVRPDHFTVRPLVVVADSPLNATKRVGFRRDPGNSCKFMFTGPVQLTSYAGRLPVEARNIGKEQEAILQLDELRPPGIGEDTVHATFQVPDTGQTLRFDYGHRREGIAGPMPEQAPAYPSDAGSLYQVRYRPVEYLQNGVAVLTNHEILQLTRLTGAAESARYRNATLVEEPRRVVRALERVNIGAVRRCQTIAGDAPRFNGCMFRLIHTLESSGSLPSKNAIELRFRLKHPEAD